MSNEESQETMCRLNRLRIDAHQHIWRRGASQYAWLDAGGLERLPSDVTIADSVARLDQAGLDGTVLVQADDTDADTELMCDAAAASPRVVGIVAWVPLDQVAEAEQRLDAFDRSLVVGVRSLIHDLPDPDWLRRPEVDATLALLAQHGCPLDVPAVLPRHLENVIALAERHPDLTLVLDHLAKPPIGAPSREPWWTLIAEAASRPNVVGKLSGLYAVGGDPTAWSVPLIEPFVARAFDVFGAECLMYGGDWPFSLIAGDDERVRAGAERLLASLSSAEREAVMGGTAARVYRLDPERLAAAASRGV